MCRGGQRVLEQTVGGGEYCVEGAEYCATERTVTVGRGGEYCAEGTESIVMVGGGGKRGSENMRC